MTRSFWSTLCSALLLLVVGVSSGCANDTTGPAPVPPDRLYTHLTLDQHAITLASAAPNNTVQLMATPYTATGAVIQDTSRATWTSSDTTSVQVSPTGVLTAIAPTTGVQVIASRQIGMVTYTDTAIVNVNLVTTPIPVASRVTLTPTTCLYGNPVVCNLQQYFAFIPTVFDQQGDTIANAEIRIRTITPAILLANHFLSEGASVWTSGAHVNWPTYAGGTAVLIIDATVYNTRITDTVSLPVPWPQQRLVEIVPRAQQGGILLGTFTPTEDTIGVGGIIIWQNALPGTALADVVFDEPGAAQAVDSATFLGGYGQNYGIVIPNDGGGNIYSFTPLDTATIFGNPKVIPAARARRFTVPGTYHYHSALYGTSGSVQVVP